MLRSILTILAIMIFAAPLSGAAVPEQSGTELPEFGGGSVSIPWGDFKKLLDQLSGTIEPPDLPPKDYALNAVFLDGSVSESKATFKAVIEFEVFSERWVKIPIFPARLALVSASLDGKKAPIGLDDGVFVLTLKGKGQKKLTLEFHAPVSPIDSGLHIELPPFRTSQTMIAFTATGTDWEVDISPSAAQEVTHEGGLTRVKAILPVADAIHIFLRKPDREGFAMLSAIHTGRTDGEIATFLSTFVVEIRGTRRVEVPLFKTEIALDSVLVGGKPASLTTRDGQVFVRIRGAGRHEIKVSFSPPILAEPGPEHIDLHFPASPVSRIKFTVTQGKKEIRIDPALRVENKPGEKESSATALLPYGRPVRIAWVDYRPPAERIARVSATRYSLFAFGDGTLSATSWIFYRIRHGKVSSVSFEVPEDAVILDAAHPALQDWRVMKENGEKRLVIFFTHPLEGEQEVRVKYEAVLGDVPYEQDLPRLGLIGIERETGYVVVAKSTDYRFEVADSANLIPVDKNRLPEPIRKRIEPSIAYTFKYISLPSSLVYRLEEPEKVDPVLYATTETLFALTEGLMKGRVFVHYRIEKAEAERFEIRLPYGIHLLNVSGNDIREHPTIEREGSKFLIVQLSNPVRGTYSISIDYERVIEEGITGLPIAVLEPQGVESSRGFIGVATLDNIEIHAEEIDGEIRPIDPSELPQALQQASSSPILLAFKYIKPRFSAELAFIRHPDVEVQAAVIDSAHYATLFTSDGISVTKGTFWVRNRKNQFLRLELPEGTRLWSTVVSGKPVRPARDAEGRILIPLKKTRGGTNLYAGKSFPVEIVFMLPEEEFGLGGSLGANLPGVDITTSQVFWSVYLPEEYAYSRFGGNVRPIFATYQPVGLVTGQDFDQKLSLGWAESNVEQETREAMPSPQRRDLMKRREFQAQLDMEADILNRAKEGKALSGAPGSGAGSLPIQLNIPLAGKLYRFYKIYPTESEKAPAFSAVYLKQGTKSAAKSAASLALFIAGFALACMLWLRESAPARRIAGDRRIQAAIFGSAALLTVFVTAIDGVRLATLLLPAAAGAVPPALLAAAKTASTEIRRRRRRTTPPAGGSTPWVPGAPSGPEA